MGPKFVWARSLICPNEFPRAKPIDKHNNIVVYRRGIVAVCHFQFDWVFVLFGIFHSGVFSIRRLRLYYNQ